MRIRRLLCLLGRHRKVDSLTIGETEDYLAWCGRCGRILEQWSRPMEGLFAKQALILVGDEEA